VTHLQYDGRYTVFDHVPEVREQWLRVSCFTVRIMCVHTDRSARTTSLSWEHPNCRYTWRRFSRLPSTTSCCCIYLAFWLRCRRNTGRTLIDKPGSLLWGPAPARSPGTRASAVPKFHVDALWSDNRPHSIGLADRHPPLATTLVGRRDALSSASPVISVFPLRARAGL
jgi:hypothetical protein